MSDDPRRTGFCTPDCYRECQCSRWPDMLDRWGNPVNHGQGGGPVILPWWNPDGATPAANVGAWLAKGAASQAASYLNLGLLGNPNIDPAVVGGVAPLWAAGTGWTFDAITTYLRTGMIEGLFRTWSMLIQFTGWFSGETAIGAYDPGTTAALYMQQWAPNRNYCHGGAGASAPDILVGNMGIAGVDGYINGAWDVACAPMAGPIPELWIGCLNFGGAVVQPTQATIIAVMVSDLTLTAPQMLARATAMAAL